MTTTLGAPPVRGPITAPRRWAITPNGALALIAVGTVATVGLWWQDTEFIFGLGSWLTNAGRITGLLCGYAVVVLLALMSRVPALEHGVGSDRLARWHAAGGRYTVCLAVAHTVLIIWGYAVSAHTGLVAETGALLTTYPDVLMATVALGLLVGVGIVSARAARRRLRYETWHLLHLYTYLAVALAFSHQFATGADFVDPRARWLWSAMYLIVAALLLWYRVLVPVVMLARHSLRVVAVMPHNRDVVSVILGGHNLARLRAEPGQFFRWRFLTRKLWWAANPYSLSAPPQSNMLRITVKVAGEHSAELARLRPGTRVLAEGPYGAFTDRRRTARKVLLIGIGIGITPLRALLESVPARPGELTLLYRARQAEDLVLADEIDAIAAMRGARVHYLLGRRGRDEHADQLSLHRLRRLVPDLAEHEVYFCGPDDLATHLVRTLRRGGIPAARIHHESFTF
jgi:predicted ferric reductase